MNPVTSPKPSPCAKGAGAGFGNLFLIVFLPTKHPDGVSQIVNSLMPLRIYLDSQSGQKD